MNRGRRFFPNGIRTMHRLTTDWFCSTMRIPLVILVALAFLMTGCGLLTNLPFLAGLVPGASKIDVVVKRRGCSEFSRTAVLTVVAPEQNGIPQWFSPMARSRPGRRSCTPLIKKGRNACSFSSVLCPNMSPYKYRSRATQMEGPIHLAIRVFRSKASCTPRKEP